MGNGFQDFVRAHLKIKKSLIQNKVFYPRIGYISVNPQKPTQNVIKSIYKVPQENLDITLFGR